MSKPPAKEFKLGQTVWIAETKTEEVVKTCPDCLGKLQWHIIIPNGEELDIECPRCKDSGTATGKVKESHKVHCKARQDTITRMEINGKGKIDYGTSGHCYEATQIHDNPEDALREAQARVEKSVAEEDKRVEERARGRGRPKKGDIYNSNPFDNAAHARRRIRDCIKEIQNQIGYAERTAGIKINMPDFAERFFAEQFSGAL